MSEPQDKLDELHKRLENLARYEEAFKREITELRRQIAFLKMARERDSSKGTAPISTAASRPSTKDEPRAQPSAKTPPPRKPSEPAPEPTLSFQSSESRFDSGGIEQYIGKYLISIVGVLITIIGVGIGAKYAIDNNWITPLMRIVFGYAVGLGLVGTATRLKEKYRTFSAVLLSGGMAIMYFITYFAYSYYGLISQTSAFSLMVIFTIFTVGSSLLYDRQIIAHIGLVGAYAVPFLLSDDSGRAWILFTYVALINVGILIVSIKKYWRFLFYAAFSISWLIYAAWFFERFEVLEHFNLAFAALAVFFATFYLTFLAYKLIHKEPFDTENVAFILLNSFIFFGFGYAILSDSNWSHLLGSFTLGNAFIHFGVAAYIRKHQLGERNAFYLLIAIVLTFVTIAVPVQLDGNWITLAWAATATFLFVIGRTKSIRLFEYFSFPLMSFALVSLVNDWQIHSQRMIFGSTDPVAPLLNSGFATSLFVALCFGAMYLIDRDSRFRSTIDESLAQLISYVFPAVFLVLIYNAFRIEIGNYFFYQEVKTAVSIPASWSASGLEYIRNESLRLFNVIWQINYTLCFLALLSFFNIRKEKSAVLGFATLVLNSILVFVFITVGLWVIGDLRTNYLVVSHGSPFEPGISHIWIRYFSYGFLAFLIAACYQYTKQKFLTELIPNKLLSMFFDLGVYFSLLVIFSSELIHWTDILNVDESYKLGLSILWALYAVALIVIGIFQRKKHTRVFAIGIFALTLVKLFVLDIAELGTISKTIVFVSIGILLLVASFLYNKFTKQIFGEDLE